MHWGAMAAVAAAASGMSGSAHAATLFDFETAAIDSYSSLTQSVDGLELTITRPGSSFSIGDTGFAPFGDRSLSPLPSSGSNTPFYANFSRGLSGLSFQGGDFNPDTDTIRLDLYSGLNGTGTKVGSTVVSYGSQSLPGNLATVSYFGSTFLSAVFIGGSPEFPNSVYYDNFSATVSVVPLPSSAPMFGAALLGLAALGYEVGRRKAAAAA